MNTTSKPLTIQKILSVVDTRQFEEIGDRWVPIPGSGHDHICSRCGRPHEIHATVLLDNGTEMLVGTGCASKENAELASCFMALDRAAKRLAMLLSEQSAHNAKVSAFEAASAMVDSMSRPEIAIGFGVWSVGREAGTKFQTLVCGDAEVRCPSGDSDERRRCVVDVWKSKRMAELGFPNRIHARCDFTREIARLQKRMEQLKAGR